MPSSPDNHRFSVRAAKAADAPAAVDVVRRSIVELCTADHHGDAEMLARWLANKTVQHFTSWLANADNHCIVAETREVLLGVGILQRSGEILLFYLAPGAQRQGIGSAIHAALEEKARGWGLRKLTLESTRMACHFYESLGYQSNGAVQSRFGGLQTYPYEKVLALRTGSSVA